MSLLDRINKVLPPKAFARNLVKAQAGKYVADFANGLGQKRLLWMIQTKKPFSTLIKPEEIAAYRQTAGQWAWAADAITDRDFYLMLPDWAQQTISGSGDLGLSWWAETVWFLRGMFRPEPPDVAPSRASWNFAPAAKTTDTMTATEQQHKQKQEPSSDKSEQSK